MGKTMFLTGAAAGYVLGARAGRERYEQISRIAGEVRQNPKVQQATESAMNRGSEMAHKVTDAAADKAPDWMPGSRGGSSDGSMATNGMPAMGGMPNGRTP